MFKWSVTKITKHWKVHLGLNKRFTHFSGVDKLEPPNIFGGTQTKKQFLIHKQILFCVIDKYLIYFHRTQIFACSTFPQHWVIVASSHLVHHHLTQDTSLFASVTLIKTIYLLTFYFANHLHQTLPYWKWGIPWLATKQSVGNSEKAKKCTEQCPPFFEQDWAVKIWATYDERL